MFSKSLLSRVASQLNPPLFDGFNRRHNYLRISLTERCNLRCLYCMPEQGIDLAPDQNLLTSDEIIRLVGVFARLGVNKIRLTGGEPLVKPDIEELCSKIRSIEGIDTLGITTNGITLPRKIHALHKAGVNRLNISLDTLDEGKFMMITRRNGLKKVLASIRLAEELNFDPVKINCVVMKGVNDDEIGNFVETFTKDRNIEVRFIEFMPFDDNQWSRNKMVSFAEMMDLVEAWKNNESSSPATSAKVDAGREATEVVKLEAAVAKSDIPLKLRLWDPKGKEIKTSRIERGVGQRQYTLKHVSDGETAKLFKFDGYRGSVGFITSMTTHFCKTCNRLRLTADGNLKVCLFGEDELSLRDLMRRGGTDAELEEVIRLALSKKFFSHGGKESAEHIASSSNRPMIKIGG